jgi:hypothetical protein
LRWEVLEVVREKEKGLRARVLVVEGYVRSWERSYVFAVGAVAMPKERRNAFVLWVTVLALLDVLTKRIGSVLQDPLVISLLRPSSFLVSGGVFPKPFWRRAVGSALGGKAKRSVVLEESWADSFRGTPPSSSIYLGSSWGGGGEGRKDMSGFLRVGDGEYRGCFRAVAFKKL